MDFMIDPEDLELFADTSNTAAMLSDNSSIKSIREAASSRINDKSNSFNDYCALSSYLNNSFRHLIENLIQNFASSPTHSVSIIFLK